MKKVAVIVAGGSGTRMQSEQPKQFIHLHNRPILYYTLKAFLDAYDDMSIILVLPEEHIGVGQEIIDAFLITDAFASLQVDVLDFIPFRTAYV